jgi:hypothetical protein
MTRLRREVKFTIGRLKLMTCMVLAGRRASLLLKKKLTNPIQNASNSTMSWTLSFNCPSSSTMAKPISTSSRTPTLSTHSKSTRINIKCSPAGPVANTCSITMKTHPNQAVRTCAALIPFSCRITTLKLNRNSSPKKSKKSPGT